MAHLVCDLYKKNKAKIDMLPISKGRVEALHTNVEANQKGRKQKYDTQDTRIRLIRNQRQNR